MNLSTSGMLANFRQDIVSRQLSVSANSGASIYYPTSSAIKSNHETDKQAEENATWFFEYKALLNSKLTTLTTALTSAYTTDLDASMTKTDLARWGSKNAMQGITGVMKDVFPMIDTNGDNIPDTSVPDGIAETPSIDPGAARTTDAYFHTFGYYNPSALATDVTNVQYSASVPANVRDKLFGVGTPGLEAVNTSYSMSRLRSNGGATLNGGTTLSIINDNLVSGTTTFTSAGSSTEAPLVLDRLFIDLKDNKNNDYHNVKTATHRVTPYPDSIEQNKSIGNNLELTLYKFFSKPENYDLIKFGLMDDLYIVGTSSLATGSQIQGSISLRYIAQSKVPAHAGNINAYQSYIEIKQERYSCFFHS